MRRVNFNKEGAFLKEEHELDMLPLLPEEAVKKLFAEDNRENSLEIVDNWNAFEQCVEYSDISIYGVEIHFVNVTNNASYAVFSTSYLYKERLKDFIRFPELMLEDFKIKWDWDKDNIFKAKLIALSSLKEEKRQLSKFHKCWPIKDWPSQTNICYVYDDYSFSISVVSVIQSLYSQLEQERKPRYLENLEYYTNYKTGLVTFNFISDVNLQHHRYRTTEFSGSFSLIDFTGTITNNGSYDYSSN